MRKALIGLLMSLVVVGFVPGPVLAQDEVEFNIYKRDGTVAVWLNLASRVSRAQVDKIRDGIDLVIEYKLRLAVPRKLFGDRLVAERSAAIRLSYRPVTEDFTFEELLPRSDSVRMFLSWSQLRRHLSDSVSVALTPVDQLDPQAGYTLEINLTLMSMTELSLGPASSDTAASVSPLRYLFRQFLVLTAFGKEEFSTKSRPFSLSEIKSES